MNKGLSFNEINDENLKKYVFKNTRYELLKYFHTNIF